MVASRLGLRALQQKFDLFEKTALLNQQAMLDNQVVMKNNQVDMKTKLIQLRVLRKNGKML